MFIYFYLFFASLSNGFVSVGQLLFGTEINLFSSLVLHSEIINID